MRHNPHDVLADRYEVISLLGQAQKDLDDVVRRREFGLDPRKVEYWTARAELNKQLGKTTEAVSDLQQAHQLDSKVAVPAN